MLLTPNASSVPTRLVQFARESLDTLRTPTPTRGFPAQPRAAAVDALELTLRFLNASRPEDALASPPTIQIALEAAQTFPDHDALILVCYETINIDALVNAPNIPHLNRQRMLLAGQLRALRQGDPLSRILVARELERQGDPEAALRELNDARRLVETSQDPSLILLLYNSALIQRTLGHPLEAAQLYRKILTFFDTNQVAPNQPHPILSAACGNLANLIATQPPEAFGPNTPLQRYDEAIALYHRAIEHAPDSQRKAFWLCNLGNLHKNRSLISNNGDADLEKAFQALNDALNQNPKLYQARITLAVVFGAIDEFEEARRQLNDALKANPTEKDRQEIERLLQILDSYP